MQEVGREPDPRFSLANERTFLAWNRTALALVAAGVAAIEFIPSLDVPGSPRLLGIPLILLGAAIAFASHGEWKAKERALRLGRPLPPSRLSWLLAVAVGVAAIAVAVFIILGDAT